MRTLLETVFQGAGKLLWIWNSFDADDPALDHYEFNPDKAKELIAQLDKGGNFEQLAKDNSKDGSATEGGDLSWFNANQMVKPFSDAVQQLEIGKYTATPVKSEFGWHVIRLEEKRATTPPPFDTVKAQLGPLVNQKKFEAHLDELVKTAKVEKSL